MSCQSERRKTDLNYVRARAKQYSQGEEVNVDIIKRGAIYDFIESHTNKGEYIERIVYGGAAETTEKSERDATSSSKRQETATFDAGGTTSAALDVRDDQGGNVLSNLEEQFAQPITVKGARKSRGTAKRVVLDNGAVHETDGTASVRPDAETDGANSGIA